LYPSSSGNRGGSGGEGGGNYSGGRCPFKRTGGGGHLPLNIT